MTFPFFRKRKNEPDIQISEPPLQPGEVQIEKPRYGRYPNGYFPSDDSIKQWESGHLQRLQNMAHGLNRHLSRIFRSNYFDDSLRRVVWSPDGKYLAVASTDRNIYIWNIEDNVEPLIFTGHAGAVMDIAWASDNQRFASCAVDGKIIIWNLIDKSIILEYSAEYIDSKTNTHGRSRTNKYSIAWSPNREELMVGDNESNVYILSSQTKSVQILKVPNENNTFPYMYITSICWSPDGVYFATASHDKIIRIWDAKTRKQIRILQGHTGKLIDITWAPEGRILASASDDTTVRIWDSSNGNELYRLEGHTSTVYRVSFSHDGRLLATVSHRKEASVKLWRTDTWEMVTTYPIYPLGSKHHGDEGTLAFHPSRPLLASVSDIHAEITIWDLDIDRLLQETQPSVQYSNARVILVGDSGVGKSGLGLVLSNQTFKATESTHGKHVWIFDTEETILDNRRKEIRETLLWDLAGQPGYRIIHQLYLNEIAIALIVFDSQSELDPFDGIEYWALAIRQAQKIQNFQNAIKIYLVAARSDRGGISVGMERITSLIKKLQLDGFFETSAKEGANILQLQEAIKHGIKWEILPKVTSNELFYEIKRFLLKEKEDGHVISSINDLVISFQRLSKRPIDHLDVQFRTCVGLVESRGLIRKLEFGDLVLLQPELLDAYASALVNSVRSEPDGMGTISEQEVLLCNYAMPESERMLNKEQEKLLLLAMLEDLLRRDIILREETADGPYLIFPSQSTRIHASAPSLDGSFIVYLFEGPISNIIATLTVRLSHSNIFQKKEFWKNVVTFTTYSGGTYAYSLNDDGNGHGILALFYDETATYEMRHYFEEYINTHLEKWVTPGSLIRQRIFSCLSCGNTLSHNQVESRKERGYDWATCPVCDSKISLIDSIVYQHPTVIEEMDISASTRRDQEVIKTLIQEKRAINDFDVFLCYHGQNKIAVKQIAHKLLEHGILPWLDEWELLPGRTWQTELEKQIGRVKSAAVFVGIDGIGPWQSEELQAFLSEFMVRNCPVIPAILPDCQVVPQLPLFLKNRTWVDFRQVSPDPLEHLISGIVGKKLYEQ